MRSTDATPRLGADALHDACQGQADETVYQMRNVVNTNLRSVDEEYHARGKFGADFTALSLSVPPSLLVRADELIE